MHIGHRKLNFDKVSFYADGALGCPYGSQFEVVKKQLVLVESSGKTELTKKLKGKPRDCIERLRSL